MLSNIKLLIAASYVGKNFDAYMTRKDEDSMISLHTSFLYQLEETHLLVMPMQKQAMHPN